MNICKYGPNDLQPPEPVEEPEFEININCGKKSTHGFYTAKELNALILELVEFLYENDFSDPIYLNGTEWNGISLDNKDMAEL